MALVSANLLGLLGAALPAAAASPASSSASASVGGVYQNPVTPDDAPDPDVISVGGQYYAFTTGGVNGHIQEFSSPDLVHWTAVAAPGALVSEPGWVNPGLEWAPTVTDFNGTWLMLYATFDEWLDAECVTEATAPAVTGPYVNNASGPLLCQPLLGASGIVYGGDIDPDVFVDNGSPYLLWKANPGGFQNRAVIWSEPLAADGESLAPGSQATPLIEQDQSWESTIENPDMVETAGAFFLFYSGGNWWDSSYAVGYAVCAGPNGPCGKPSTRPILASAGPVVGPGGEWAFLDNAGQWWMAYGAWTSGSVGYPTGARSLRIDPLCFATGAEGGPATAVVVGPTASPQPLAQSCPSTDPNSQYQMVASDGGLFAYGGAAFFGSMGGRVLSAPVVGLAVDAGTGGYWEVGADGRVYGFNAPTDGDLDGDRLRGPIVGIAATPDGGGYWLVAADGGVFAYGDAPYFGSMGSTPLNRPIVGMAAMPDGGGYWLVAADGGIFAYGDAPFRGSTGGLTLNQPIVGMADDGDGGGYWLVAADGGVFAYGSARFEGSTGSLTLNQPIVGIAVS